MSSSLIMTITEVIIATIRNLNSVRDGELRFNLLHPEIFKHIS